MIQDIWPKRMRNEYQPKAPGKESRIMAFWDSEILCKVDQETKEIRYPTYAEWETGVRDKEADRLVYLFSIDRITYYLYADKRRPSLSGYEYERMFHIRGMFPQEEKFAGVCAYHLYRWYQENQYCGCCGGRMEHDKKQRMLYCKHCRLEVYPRINPAVIVAVYHQDEILFTRYAEGEYRRYALIAGFAEFGETIEQTVQREVKEEVGLEVTNLQYYKSQPWGFSQSMLFGFFAEAVGDLTIHRQEEELSEALWVKAGDIETDRENVSLTSEMMWVFQEWHHAHSGNRENEKQEEGETP